MGVSTGAVYATWNTVPMWCTIVFVYLALRLLIPEQPPGKRFLLLLLLCVFWSPSLRMSCAMLLFALFLRGCYAVAEQRAKPYLAGTIVAVLCCIAFLLAADTGGYGIAALLAAVGGVGFEFRSDLHALRRIVLTLLATALSWAVMALVVNAVMAKPFDFRFWTDQLATVSVFRWTMPFPMRQAGAIRLFGTLLGGVAIFGLCATRRASRPTAATKRTGFLLGGALFCLVLMQTALVRSDEHHIGAALLATVFLSGAILFSFTSERASTLGVIAALAFSLFFGEVRTDVLAPMKFEEVAFAPEIPRHLLAQLRNPSTECPAGFAEFDRACFPADFAGILQDAVTFLKSHSGPQDTIVIFPYQTRYGIASRRNVAGALLQAHTTNGAALSQMEITSLERSGATAGLYLPDADFGQLTAAEADRWRESDLSLPIDGVSNFTRAPAVWFWLQRHFHAEQQIGMGIVGLQRDDGRAARISMREQPLGLVARTYPIRDRRTVLELGTPDWPSGTDFLHLRLTVHYPAWWKLRKPERMELEIVRADDSTEVQWFVLPPNTSSEVWFYPWKRSGLAHYFDADEARWRPGPRPAIVGFRLLVTPLDSASQKPDSVTIETADAITLGH